MKDGNISEFHANIGKILGMALHIETTLEFFIYKYLLRNDLHRQFFFQDSILTRMNFEHKIAVFDEICQREQFSQSRVSKIISDIRFVKKIRNGCAHWQAEMNSDQVMQLRKRKSFTTKKDVLKPDFDLMKKVDERRLSAIQGIISIYTEMGKKQSIDDQTFVV